MKLTREQSKKLLQERGIWVTNACDKCGQLLGSVSWTRKGEPGEWCSALCRDGVSPRARKESSKTCRECGVSLQGKRTGSEFCSDVHRKRFAKSSTARKSAFIAETPIGKQGLTDAQNAVSMNTLTRAPEALETVLGMKCFQPVNGSDSVLVPRLILDVLHLQLLRCYKPLFGLENISRDA